MSAKQYCLDNVIAIIDRNSFQLGGHTEDVMDIGNMTEKLTAFGWDVREVNGHDIRAIMEAFTKPGASGCPVAIVANTVKGYGFSFSANNNAWHHAVLTKELYETGMRELGKEPVAEKIQTIRENWTAKKESQQDDSSVKNAGNNTASDFVLTRQLSRRWSMIGQRAAFGMALLEEAKKYPKLKVLTADVSTSAGLERFRKNIQNQYLDVGIAEQNMMGIASGLSSMGYDVVTTTFAPFQTMRCLEQIRVNMGYMGQKVVMVGLASGLVLGTLGNTHCCFEDLGVLRSIPNIAIISPADSGEVGKALSAAVQYPTSVYIRLMAGGNCPVVYQEDYEYIIGKAILLRDVPPDIKNITIYAIGTMVSVALQVGELLKEKGIFARIVNMHTVKPIDQDEIHFACKISQKIVTIEEHNIYGGLGTAVAEVMATTNHSPQQLRIGLPDAYGHGGEYKDLLKEYGLTAESIVQTIVDSLQADEKEGI
jgi:transketolase